MKSSLSLQVPLHSPTLKVVRPSKNKERNGPQHFVHFKTLVWEKYKKVCFATPAVYWPARTSFTGFFFVDVREHVTLKDTAAFCVTACSLCSDSAQQQQNKIKINSLPKARGWGKNRFRDLEKKNIHCIRLWEDGRCDINISEHVGQGGHDCASLLFCCGLWRDGNKDRYGHK